MLKPDNYIEFTTDEERTGFISIFGFLKKNINSNKFTYKGLYSDQYDDCSIVGYTHDQTLIIKIHRTSELHTINGFYLKDMQSPQFDLKKALEKES